MVMESAPVRRVAPGVTALEQVPVSALTGIGPAQMEKLARLQLKTVADLLFHLPLRYEDRTRLTSISALQSRTSAQIDGEILGAELQFGRRRSLLARFDDGSGQMDLRFFYFNKAVQERLQRGGHVRVFGEVRFGRNGFEMVHPELQWRDVAVAVPLLETLTPVYPVTEGLSQQSLRRNVRQALRLLSPHNLRDWLPVDALKRERLPDLYTALHSVHEPQSGANIAALLAGTDPAIVRLALEELIANQLCFLQARQRVRRQSAPSLPAENTLGPALAASLPFTLTSAQQRVLTEIRADMVLEQPMLRLVQGDVGSGKTLVAAFAALNAISAGKQVALMAPTELLAEQHAQNFRRWFEPLGLKCEMLAGKTKGRARERLLQRLAAGEIQLLLGTHALFQEGVSFQHLALVIVDEQHRFGVHQRLQLFEKGRDLHSVPHQLIMTATPIPRTLAMTAYADLDSSIIDELPPGRSPVGTVVIPEQRRDEVIERVRVAITQGRQVYWVCTLIEESDQLEAQAAQAAALQLQTALPAARIGLVHGRLKAAEKLALMTAFKQHELDILVATTVIEVGVDVPNASLMIIENAERLGLSQLHQLRGRVGRGSIQSHCVLLYHAPLSVMGKERLAVMRETNDGFVIAERDMELRGPGELLGTRQTGVMVFKIADIARDQRWVPQAAQIAKTIMQSTPDAITPLIARWMGTSAHYGQV